MSREPVHLGVNVYSWGVLLQNRLLEDWLAPTMRELRRDHPASRCWFDRFYARGPHLMALFTVPATGRADAVRLITGRLEEALAHCSGDLGAIDMDAAEGFHRAVRGVALCEVDREPGMAEEGSYRLFEQPADGYPFRLTRGLPAAAAEAIWELDCDLALWTIERLEDLGEQSATRTAVRWLAAFDLELRRSHPRPEGFWRYFAGTLLYGIPKRLAEDEEGVLRALPGLTGGVNSERFARVWREVEDEGPPWPRLAPLVQGLVAASETSVRAPWSLARELVHWTLRHLCLDLRAEVPLILYAWSRNLPSAPSLSR